ncbi:MAG: hypothetical protein EOP06_10050 [Proteobacteria bacterium]|nr:MAG: hypothetical protein EOP06_10050 [Pseudomonadota bacterium]
MNLSVRGLDELRANESFGKARVLFLLDPKSDFEIAKKIVNEHSWPKESLRTNASETLFARGTRVHYPSYQLVKNGQLLGPLFPGYKNAVQLKDFVERHTK